VAANPGFRPDELSAVRFAFAGESGGGIYLDDIAVILA
jgi:hypothetical protein